MIAAAGINWWAVGLLAGVLSVAAFVVVVHGCGKRLDGYREITSKRDDFVDHVAWQYRDQPGDPAWDLTEALRRQGVPHADPAASQPPRPPG